MTPITNLDELKSIELEIMKKIHDFCEEKGINYTLAAGTLLGAIRHNGFIPWDDDIDIYVNRKDYWRFEKEFPEWGESRGLYIAGPHSKKHYFPRDMLKVCDDRTALIETSYKRTDPIGVFVDIWPLDELPELSFKTSLWRKQVRLYRNLNLAADISKSSVHGWKEKLAVLLFGYTDTHKWTNKMENTAIRYLGKGTGRLISFQGFDNTYSEKDFEERILWPFEDTKFYVPKGFDGVLRDRYGDYMTLPPKEQQVPHHVQNVWYK